MEAKELRTFSIDELKARVRQWRDELFRARFKTESSEAKDTSILRKLKRDIARGETVLTEKRKNTSPVQNQAVAETTPSDQAVAAQDKGKARKSKSKGVESHE